MSDARVNTNSTRRQQILEAFARELETRPGSRITTAGLARALGVSEAALYRHFPSKARMFEGLIAFAEEAVFGIITRILEEQPRAIDQCEHITRVVLGFAERNPGIARILAGDALVGVQQFFDRIETQLRQTLRQAVNVQKPRLGMSVNGAAGLMLTMVEGRLARFVRSGFSALPTQDWDESWQAMAQGIFES